MKAFFIEFWTFVNENRIVSGVVTTVVASILLSIWKKNPTWFFFSILVLFGIIVLFFWYSRQNTPDKTVSSGTKVQKNPQLPPVVKTPPKLKAGDVQTLTLAEGVKLEMVYCPAGTFTMGSPDGESEYPKGSGEKPKEELGRWSDETPHEVTLTKGFWIGKYEVTQAQYRIITGENPSDFKGNNRPVEEVSWNDCVTFCEKLNELRIAPAGYRFALPTEAQWEYACRAGTTTALNNGMSLTSEDGECPNLDEVGWYDENSDGKTHPVGQKQPNAWGIYDMHGNVYEWCTDWYGSYHSRKETDPEGPEIGEGRVLRGGSWGSPAWLCRSANRDSGAPFYCFRDCGFRLALVPE